MTVTMEFFKRSKLTLL